MPKQSKTSNKSRSKEVHTEEKSQLPRTKVLWFLRYSPIDLFVFTLILSLSLSVRWWPFEFVASYTPQILVLSWVYMLVYATFATWYVLVRSGKELLANVGKLSLSTLLASGVMGVYAFSYSINIIDDAVQAEGLTFQADNLTVGTFNKLYRSSNFANDAELISASKVDVFSLQEVKEAELEFVKERVNHDYSFITDCDCSAKDTEVGIVSRYPITNALTIYEHENAAIARVLIDSEQHGEFVVYVVHMHVPYENAAYNLRDDALATLSQSMNAEIVPTFAIGDFNTTIYSPDLQNFMDSTKVSRNVVSRTWPRCSWFGTIFGELACARIDYVFAPNTAVVHGVQVGDESFSDHRSVIVELSI